MNLPLNSSLCPPRQVQTLLVDLDGTLLGNRSLQLSWDFTKKALSAFRRHGDWRQSMQTLLAVYRELGNPEGKIANDVRVVSLFARRMKISEDDAREFLRSELLKIFPTLSKHFYPIEGAKEFLSWASGIYPLVLATNPVWPIEITEMRVRWAGIDPAVFKFITYVREARATKPHPAYYREILQRLDLKAERCLLVGDDPKMDVPASKVGIAVFVVGEYKRFSVIKGPPGATAPVYRGTYAHLRELLGSWSQETR